MAKETPSTYPLEVIRQGKHVGRKKNDKERRGLN